MPNLEKKQKIIIAIVLLFMVGVIIYYCYTCFQKTNEEIFSSTEETNEIQEETEKNNEEKEDDEEIIIDIAGQVQKEGIIKLKEGSRIADAIEKAGGLKENASTKNINLAYKLEDGQKIYIPSKEEDQNQTTYITDSESGSVSNIQANQEKVININTATQEQLEDIPGIGESTAQKIITYRNENGKFKTIEEIKNVSGIGEAKFNQMKEYIKV